mgnify:FL=1
MIELLLANVSGEWIQRIREHEAQQDRAPIEDVINSSLEDFNDGCNGSTEQEELLQLPCYEDQEGLRRRYDRCNNRPRVRPSEDGESEDCWSGHTREENEGLGGEGTWIRCDQLVEGEIRGDN